MSNIRGAIGRTHAAIYRKTKGRIGGKVGSQPLMLLTTTGRKSGLERTTPVGYHEDNGDYVIVALGPSGSLKHPAWYLNLTKRPTATVQVRDRIFRASAETASPEERARLWPIVVERAASVAKYQAKVEREIPLVVLSPKQD